MKREQMVEKLKANLSGLTIQSFKLLEGGTLILYLSHASAVLPNDTSSTRLWIESAWRICTSIRVVAGSLDGPDLLMAQLGRLVGRTICSVQLTGVPGDIVVMLDSGLTIESFTRDIGDEQWQVRRSDGMRLGLGEHLELYEAFVKPD